MKINTFNELPFILEAKNVCFSCTPGGFSLSGMFSKVCDTYYRCRNCCERVAKTEHGAMVELVDTYGLGPYAERCEGSSPFRPTTFIKESFDKFKMLWRVMKDTCVGEVGESGRTKIYNDKVIGFRFYSHYPAHVHFSQKIREFLNTP